MRKILTIIPFAVDEAARLAHEQALQRDAAPRGTSVSVVSLARGPTPVAFSEPGFEHAIAEIVQVAQRYQDEFDGILISCFEDPGLVEVRKVARIPVVGPCETALQLAHLAGGNFFIVSPDLGSEPLYRKLAADMRLADCFAAFVHVPFEIEQVSDDAELPGRVAEAIRAAPRRTSAETAILGCTALTECYDTIRALAGGRVIEPTRASIQVLELLIDLGPMTTSTRAPSALIQAFWIEKYLTFSQNHEGALIPTDHMFLAEYVLRGDVSDAKLFKADFFRAGTQAPLQSYGGEDQLWCNRHWVNRKVRSFDTLAALEQAHPPSDIYYWEVSGFHVAGRIKPMRIGGPEGKTQIPRPHAMRLSQHGQRVRELNAIDASAPLLIEWDRFENATAGAIIDDTIFVFIDDCRGEVVYFGGLPIDAQRINFDSTSLTVSAGTLKPGQPYTVFFSQCRMVDQDASDGLINCAVNSFGIEFDLHTAGINADQPCPEPRLMAPYRWKRKTRVQQGLETWPTIADV